MSIRESIPPWALGKPVEVSQDALKLVDGVSNLERYAAAYGWLAANCELIVRDIEFLQKHYPDAVSTELKWTLAKLRCALDGASKLKKGESSNDLDR